MPDIVVLADGVDSRLEILLEAQLQRNLKDGVLRLLVSPDRQVRALADGLGIETLVPTAATVLGAQIAEQCDPAIIVQTVWKKALARDFHERFAHKIIALHAALPGQFPGEDPTRQAWQASQRGDIRWSGCHVYQVGPEGAPTHIIRQLVVPVSPGDDFARFSKRMALGERWVLLKSIKQLLYELRNAQHGVRRNRGQPCSKSQATH